MKSHKLFFEQYYKMYRPFVSQLNQKLVQHELYSSQYAVLKLIHTENELTLGEISRHQAVERPTITRTVQRLKELGFVQAGPGKDKREKMIHLTPLGEDMYQDIRHSIADFQLKSLEGISEDELLNTIDVLAKVHQNLTSIEGE